uniref:M23 family metallopeptidase n=1 Tax=Desulfobacca acetoxidans TaxID=60893 RepID=A0A7C3V869_9BACT
MLTDRNSNWGKKSWFFLAGLVLGALALVVFLILGSLDSEDPWLTPSAKPAVVVPKAGFTLKAGDRDSGLKEVKVTINQGGQDRVVLSRTFPPGGEPGTPVEIPIVFDPQALGLKEGKATIAITAVDRSRRNFFRGRSAQLSWDAEVSLIPIKVSFVAASHLMSPGGSGLVVYRINKTPKESGIRIADRFFPGYPVPKGPPGEYGAFLAIPLEARSPLPAEIIARAGVGNEDKQAISLRLSPKRWRHDKMNLSEGFLSQVAAKFPEANQGDLLKTFLEVNQKTRQANHDKVRRVCAVSQSQPLWTGAFQRFLGKPMARFGDQRTYVYQNKNVDNQVHQGEDLASLANSPVPAANNGVVVLAEPLGIYGNTVVLDHGLGVFTMYSHLSRIDVKNGEQVEKGRPVGLTGTTGLAGGDHLHYSVLIDGYFVNPVEWWDAHWFKDQVEKVWTQTAAAAAAEPGQAAAAPTRPRKGKKRQR